MKSRLLSGLLAAVLLSSVAQAQITPPFGPNDSPTEANWLAFWKTVQSSSPSGNFAPNANDAYTLGAFGAAWSVIFGYQVVAATDISTPYLQVGGTPPTLTTGSCSGSGAVGGTAAGTFVAAACSAGTYILSGLPAATHGWACFATDQTTTTDTLIETASTTTSATLKATTAASDVVQFWCAAY